MNSFSRVYRVFIRRRRSENCLATMQNSSAKFCSSSELKELHSFIIILLLLYTILLLLQFLMKTLVNKEMIFRNVFLDTSFFSLSPVGVQSVSCLE